MIARTRAATASGRFGAIGCWTTMALFGGISTIPSSSKRYSRRNSARLKPGRGDRAFLREQAGRRSCRRTDADVQRAAHDPLRDLYVGGSPYRLYEAYLMCGHL